MSRIESGDRLVRLTEIDVWVRVTGASASVRAELASLAETAANQISPWRSRLHAGVDQTQRETAELEAAAATILKYDHAVIPGLLQVRPPAWWCICESSIISVPGQAMEKLHIR